MTEPAPTRDRILEAAITAIDQGGEASLRIDSIAEAAGITKPSIYHFFGDRDGLVAAAQAERYRRSVLSGLEDAIEATLALNSRGEFEKLLPVYVDIAMDPAGAMRRAGRIQVLGSAVSRPKLTEEVVDATKRAMELTTRVVEIPIERGWIDADVDADAIALWWISLTLGRHLFDLVDDQRLHERWRDIALANLRYLYLGSFED